MGMFAAILHLHTALIRIITTIIINMKSYLFEVLSISIASIQLMLFSSKGTICAQDTIRVFAPM